MVRAVRLAATLDFEVEPATLAAIREKADNVRHLSGERIAIEMRRLLAAERPSIGLRLMADTGLLAAISPDLAAQPGVPQNKVPGEDLWDHTLRAVDGAATEPPRIRLAALLHDIGKPLTMADGRFLGHESVGAELADKLLDDWRWPVAERQRIVRLIRHHMFGYQPTWSDAAVRRFIVKVGSRGARGPVPAARGGPHRIRARAECRRPGRAPRARRQGARRRRGARPQRAGGRRLGPDGGAGHRAGPGAGPPARLAAGAGHRRPVGQHARGPARPRAPATQLGEGADDRAAARSRAGPVVRPRRRGGAALPAGGGQPTRPTRSRSSASRASRSSTRTTRAPTCSRARPSRSTPRTRRPNGWSPASTR